MNAANHKATTAPIWPQWQRLTRLLFSGQIAFNSELARWDATDLDMEHGVRLRDRTFNSKYRVTLDQHLEAIRDRSEFFGLILIKAYSLMDAHGRFIRYVLDTKDFGLLYREATDAERQQIFDIHLAGGIEAWGGKLLSELNRDWRIIDGKEGLIQTSIVRNALAHGYAQFTRGMADAALARGVTSPYDPGVTITLTFDQCRQHLARMKSFCRRLDGGLINVASPH